MLGRNDEALAQCFEKADRYWAIPLNGARGLSRQPDRSIQAGKSTAHSGMAQAYHRHGPERGGGRGIQQGDRNLSRSIPTPTSAAAMPAPRSASTEPALADYNEAVRLGPGLLARLQQPRRAARRDGAGRQARLPITTVPSSSIPASPAPIASAAACFRGEARTTGPWRISTRRSGSGPSDAGGYKDRGGVLVRLGQYERAIDDLNRAIELDPEPGRRLPEPRGGLQQPGPVRAGDRRPEQGHHARPQECRGPHEHRARLLHDRPVRAGRSRA